MASPVEPTTVTVREARGLWRGPAPTTDRVSRADALIEAREVFLACDRVEMRTLAQALGVGRSTLYRWFGDRHQLLGEVLWGFAHGLLEEADAATAATGTERIAIVAERFGLRVAGFEPLRSFLVAEPETALRVLTTKASRVQRETVRWFTAAIREERAAARMSGSAQATTLAYVIVRMGELFLYADQIAGERFAPNEMPGVLRLLLRD